METNLSKNNMLYTSSCDDNNNNNNMECVTYNNSSPTSISTCSSELSYTTNLTPFSKPKPKTTSKQAHLSSKYKGVVAQPNGHWGAQLYEGTKRVWVGTFESQELAARAYDTAVIRYRGPCATTNFPIKYYNRPSYMDFLGAFSKHRIIEMLRTHTFNDELARFLRARIALNRRKRAGHHKCLTLDRDLNPSREQLFKKVVTPSDVGKLHRLVIPKHYAKRYLPDVSEVGTRGIMLSFEDEKSGKMWRFKYCYWSSSQNYVLTRGWGEFVKEKGLKPGDVVNFYSSLGCGGKLLYIDTTSARRFVKHNNNVSHTSTTSGGCGGVGSEKMLRLFGVDICPLTTTESISTISCRSDNEGCGNSEKMSMIDDCEVVTLADE